jgi:hypothetical protein
VLSAYRFLCQAYEKDDKVWLFGFSRGAYTVRALAAFVHVIGVLPQLNLATYAFTAYKKSSADSQRASSSDGVAPDGATHSAALEAAWQFSRVAGGNTIRIAFVGVWDTVASAPLWRAFLCANHIFCCWKAGKTQSNFWRRSRGTARVPNCLVAKARALSFRSIVPGPASAGLCQLCLHL